MAKERLAGFGGAQSGVSRVFRPASEDEVIELFRRRPFRTVGLRGAGRSYGDASLNSGGAVLDLSRLDAFHAWDPETGVVEVGPGVTIEDLWRSLLPRGWWPKVVPGTMFVTVGGAVAMNIHGKNCFRVGPFGEHLESLEVVLPTGERRTASPGENADLFHGVVAGFGMLGCVTRARLRLGRVHSGRVRVRTIATGSLRETVEVVERHAAEADYLVGWADGLARGAALGRGVVHRADHYGPGEDPEGEATLAPGRQELPARLAGVVPKSWLGPLARPFLSNALVAGANRAKVQLDRIRASRHAEEAWTHVEYAFLLDYAPGWSRMYGPAGLIQIQPFVPRDAAVEALEAILRLARRRGLPPYLCVFKKHRPDPFLMTHGLDGYSLAMDFPARRRDALWDLAREIERIAIDAGGRFYAAKDSTLTAEALRASLPPERAQAFLDLKRKCDPDGVLQTDLSRRIWPELGGRLESRPPRSQPQASEDR